MDREKRRSEEDEKELDRKIALIREKNQKIEQRTKEIEEDRARNEDQNGKSPKTTQLQLESKSKTGQWSREWDKGKTPVDKWRENVPSIDLKDRLANSKSSAARSSNHNNNNNNKNRNGEAKNHKNITAPKIPSRLEGRITFPNQHKSTERHEKEQKRGNQQKQEQKKKPINEEDVSKGQRRRQKIPKKSLENQQEEKKSENKEESAKKNRNRPRRESENYAVRKVVRGMIEKVCWIERLEKRKSKKEEENKESPKQFDLEKTRIEENVLIPVVEEKPKNAETEKASDEDANQNVIKLVREKVVTLTMSQIN